jgi:hypothetical protein
LKENIVTKLNEAMRDRFSGQSSRYDSISPEPSQNQSVHKANIKFEKRKSAISADIARHHPFSSERLIENVPSIREHMHESEGENDKILHLNK